MGGPEPSLRFGEFVLDPARAELRRGDTVVSLQPQVFDGLTFFARHPGVLHTREALHEALWPGVFVAEDALSQLIRKIRVGLDDTPTAPRYLETVPRRGYRFIADVVADDVAPGGSDTPAVLHVLAPVATLYGREEDLAAATAALAAEGALVTVTGTGGLGKSHLARAVHDAWADRVDDTARVDLQDAAATDALLLAVATALDVPLQGDSPDDHTARIGHALAARGACLCILDDLDQLHEVAPTLLARWRAVAPRVRWLLTARRPLGVVGEQVVELQPLPRAGSRDLFRARAQSLGVTVDAADDVLDQLLDRLDDSPLAIELAASRTRVLGVADLVRRMDAPLGVLRDRQGHRHARHQSLQACLRASWDPLPAPHKQALAALSVLPASAPPATAEALLAACLPDEDPLDLLEDLRAHALLHADTRVEGFVLLKVLDSVGAFVRAEPEAQAARAHASAAVVPVLVDRVRALARREPTSPLHRQDRALLTGLLDTIARPGDLVDALAVGARWLREAGPYDVARRAVDRARAASAVLTPQQRATLAWAELELTRDGHGDVARLQQAARDAADAVGDATLKLAVDLDVVERHHPGEDVQQLLTEAEGVLARARTHGDAHLVATAVRRIARLLMDAGRLDEVWTLIDGALVGLPDGPDRAGLLDARGLAEAFRGHPDAADRALEEALAIYGRLGWTRRIAVQHANLAGQLVMQGDRARALQHLERSGEVAARIGDHMVEATVLINAGVQHLFELDGDAAEHVLQRARRIAPKVHASTVWLNLSTAAWLRGELREALARAEAGLEVALGASEARPAALNQAWRAALLAALDAPDDAEQALDAVPGMLESPDASVDDVARLVGLHVAAARGATVRAPAPPHAPRTLLLLTLLARRRGALLAGFVERSARDQDAVRRPRGGPA
ncbi:MAG: winged helix-turn-helix domain-containing protein [Alphaproteobacteria bacterium]|nr:winged helix-turn-helix domain-containing protein [Alphaproteobacteria bacterium]